MSLVETIKNTLQTGVESSIRGHDFPEGFVIEEILPSGSIYKSITLTGNLMPMIPFKFGGKQRIKKDYYSGDSEPSVQVLGSEESDTVIKGRFKDKKYDPDLYGTATEIQQFIDAIRLRGNLCRFVLGEWQRYGFIEETDFDMTNLADVKYQIKLSLVGFNAPKNAKFMEQQKTVPFTINEELVDKAQVFEDDVIPDTVPRSIGDKLNELTSTVAGSIALVTDFVDNVFSTIQDVQKAVQRAKGLVQHSISKLNEYKRSIASFDPFDTEGSLAGKYQNAQYYQKKISESSEITAIMVALRANLSGMILSVPQARYVTKDGDTLQSISILYFGSAEYWKDIYDYNDLDGTDLTDVTTLDIPRLQ